MKMVLAMQGANPFEDSSAKLSSQNGKEPRHVPPPDKLPRLTPDAFDAMFPGKKTGKVRHRRGAKQ